MSARRPTLVVVFDGSIHIKTLERAAKPTKDTVMFFVLPDDRLVSATGWIEAGTAIIATQVTCIGYEVVGNDDVHKIEEEIDPQYDDID